MLSGRKKFRIYKVIKNNYFSDLKNKVVVITGGNGFMGTQYSKAFKELGSIVVSLDKKKSKNKFFYLCDITNEFEVKDTLKKIIKEHKKVDILINNASIDHVPSKKIENYSLENFDSELWLKDLSMSYRGFHMY